MIFGFMSHNSNAVKSCPCGHSFDTSDNGQTARACGKSNGSRAQANDKEFQGGKMAKYVQGAETSGFTPGTVKAAEVGGRAIVMANRDALRSTLLAAPVASCVSEDSLGNLGELRVQYRRAFYDLLMRVSPHKPDLGVRALMRTAETLAAESGISFAEACDRTYHAAEIRTERKLAKMRSCRIEPDQRGGQG